MKRNFFLSLIIGIIFFNSHLIFATGDPVISLSPANGTTTEGGINGYGKTVTISYDVSGLESCWWRGEYLGFEVWLYIDGNQVSYYRDSERQPVGNHYGLTYSNSLSHYLSQGSHSIRVVAKNFEVKFDLYLDTNEASTTNTVQINPPPRITVDNNFTDQSGTTHGLIVADDYGTKTAPFSFEKNSGQKVSLSAISPQTNNQNYQVVWHSGSVNQSGWFKNLLLVDPDQSFSFNVTTSDNGATYQAQLRKLYNITFNAYSSININGTSYSSPTTNSVVEQNSLTASPSAYSVSNVNFTFENWKKDGVTYPATFTPTDHGSYNAIYRAKPSNSGEYVTFSNNYNQPIVIYWTDNPNPNVTQYKIYRKVKHNGVVGPETLIGTVGSGVQSFTDQEYLATSTYSDDLLWYDVRAYYNSTDPYIIGDYSDAAYYAVYGKESLIKMNESASTSELPTEYSVRNYPNPFNPTTTIKYGLPESGFVILKVYDILGREVVELVNENKSAGYYEVSFNASGLTSGVYIYTIQTAKYSESKKMILAK